MSIFSILMGRRNQAERIAMEISRLRRAGRHFYQRDWHFTPDSDPGHIAEVLIGWCREVAASCRRPYGIDFFDLALAASEGEDAESLALNRLRPVNFYGEALEGEIRRIVQRAWRAGESGLRVSAALFSWGDAANEALPGRP